MALNTERFYPPAGAIARSGRLSAARSPIRPCCTVPCAIRPGAAALLAPARVVVLPVVKTGEQAGEVRKS